MIRADIRSLSGLRAAGWRFLLIASCLAAILTSACSAGRETPPASEGDRATVSLAVLDDVGHRAALYAIDAGLVTSRKVDLNITYLPQTALDQALPARQYDLIEAPPETVGQERTEHLGLLVVSGGMQDMEGTVLFARADGTARDASGLRGRKIAVISLDDPATLATRYLLQERYGLDATPGGNVALVEAPVQSLAGLVRSGEAAGAVMQQFSAYVMEQDGEFLPLSRVTEELRQLTGESFMASVLVTYGDIAAQKASGLEEVGDMLTASLAYFEANMDRVGESLQADHGVDPVFLRWWWDHYGIAFGDASSDVQTQILRVWDAAKAVGNAEGYPELADVLFRPDERGRTPDD